MNRIEQLIGEAILQDTKEIVVAGQTYHIGKPSVATVIEASKYISRLPAIPAFKEESDRLTFVLSYAKDCELIGDIAALLLLGKKNMTTTKEFLGIPYKKIDNIARLSSYLLEDFSTEELSLIIAESIGMQRIGFFLTTITILNEANLLKRTK